MAMTGRCASAPRASPGAPVGTTLMDAGVGLGAGVALGCVTVVGGLLIVVGAGAAAVGALVAAAGAAVGAVAACSELAEGVGAGTLGCPPQAANASVPPSISASRRN